MALINIDPYRSPKTSGTWNSVAMNPLGNQIYWVFNTEATGSPDAKARGYIRLQGLLLGLLAVGDAITISGAGGSATFTARNNPSVYELQAGATGLANTDRLFQALSEHPQFKPYYTFSIQTVSPTQNLINIVARYPGSAYDLSFVVSTAVPVGLTANATQLGTNAFEGSALKDFSIVVKLFINTTTGSKQNFPFNFPYNPNEWEEVLLNLEAKNDPKDNIEAIDFRKALAPLAYCTPPQLDLFSIESQPQLLVKYYFEYYAQYIPDGETSPRRFLIDSFGKSGSEKLYAFAAGLPQTTQPVRIHDSFRYFWQRLNITEKVNFLTSVPIEKTTHVDSYEFLYFVYHNVRKNRAGLGLRFNLYFEDGSSLLNQDTPMVANTLETAFYVQVGWRKIRASFGNFEAAQGSLLRKFDVRVIDGIGFAYATSKVEVTLPQTFVMDNSTRCVNYESAQLIFKNPYGVFETFRFSGFYERESETETKSYATQPRWKSDQFLPTDYLTQLPLDELTSGGLQFGYTVPFNPAGLTNAGNYDSSKVKRYTLKSGLINRKEMDWLEYSLFTSNEAHLVAWTEPDNLGNPNLPLMRRVVFEKRTVNMDSLKDNFEFEITVRSGLPDTSING